MPTLLDVALLLIACWGSLATLGLVDARLRRSRDLHLARPPQGAVPGWAPRALVALAFGSALARLGLVFARAGRNIDESQYAAQVAFARHAGESLFASPYNLRGPLLLYRLGSWEDPFTAVELATCAAYGLTAWLLGWTLLRALRRPGAACLAVIVYALGTLRFEGLSANTEPYVNLCLAAWLWVRFGRDESRPALGGTRRDLAAGFALGLAAVMKEQALPYALLEALLGLALWGRGALSGARLLRRWAWGAAGWWLAWLPWILGLVAAGTLGQYLALLLGWGQILGAPEAGHEVAVRSTLLLDLAAGLLPLWSSPLGLLGLAGLLRAALEASQLGRPGRRLELGLALACGVSLACLSLGARWFDHYFLLAWVPLSGLAALRLADLVHELRQRPNRGTRVLAGVLALSALVLVPFELSRLPFQASGDSLDAEGKAAVARTAAVVQEVCPSDQTLFVWGWREELYVAARRAPATRLRAGWKLFAPAPLLPDLQARPPGAVVLVGGDADDGWSLDRQPELVAWLRARYRPIPVPAGAYPVLVPGGGE